MRKDRTKLRERALLRRLKAKFTHVEVTYHNEEARWEVRFGFLPNAASCWDVTKLSALETAVAMTGA